MDGYSVEIEEQMVRFFDSLNERDRRRYAGLEAEKLGHGGVAYISQLFSCDPKTVQHGKSEMYDQVSLETQRQRKKTADAKRRKLLRQKLSKRSAKS
jgi:hypothetical protein